jgi:putative spermidine/putrescine transport system substrate-binding protein
VLAAFGVVGTLVMFPNILARENLTVVSWGGAYQQAQIVAFFHPFVDRTDIDLDGAIYGGGLDEIRNQIASGEVVWDVVDLDLADAFAACEEGLLEPIDPATFPPGANGEDAEIDFVPGAVGPCWAGTVVYSQIILYAPNAINGAPQTAADFFNLETFPGARALRDSGPEHNLPFALLADGVAPSDVYSLLETEEGIARAFAKLESLGGMLSWWRAPNEPIDMLARGDVIMSTALNGRAFEAQTQGAAIATLWDGQLYGLDVFGIPKGTPARERAMEFVAFASSPVPLAQMAGRVPYGPARLSANTLVEDNPMTGASMLPFLPTAPDNFQNALLIDPEWWSEHGQPLRAAWEEWRGGQN